MLCEDTGFSDRLPTGEGLLSFSEPGEAIAGVAEIDGHYAHHMSAARDLAAGLCDSRDVLPRLIGLCDVPEQDGFDTHAEPTPTGRPHQLAASLALLAG